MHGTINTLVSIIFHRNAAFSIHRYTIQHSDRDDPDGEQRQEDKFVVFSFTGHYLRAAFNNQKEAEDESERLFDKAVKGPLIFSPAEWSQYELDITSAWGEGQPTELANLRASLQSFQQDPNEIFIRSYLGLSSI